MKKVFLIAAVFMLVFGIHVSAEELFCESIDIFDYSYAGETSETMLMELPDTEEQAKEEIVRCMRNGITRINVSYCKFSKDRVYYVGNSAFMENPDIYYVDTEWYYWYDSLGYVTQIDIKYLHSPSQIEVFDKVIEAEKQKVLGMIDRSMTELEKVMLIHNYVVTNHEYDYSYEIHNIYDFFNERKGVCQAYTQAMTYFLRAAGIECSYALSKSMNHTWNMVKVDGNWYHIDATWDDSNYYIDRCSYEYFLKNDEWFETYGDHYGWESDYESTSTWYNDYYFKKYSTPILYQNGDWYVQYDGSLYKIDNLKIGTMEKVFTPEYEYKSGWYASSYMNFGVYGDSFIYNTHDGIYVVNLNDYAKPRRIIQCGVEDCEIYALVVTENVVYYQTSESAYADYEVHTMELDTLVSLNWFEIRDVNVTGESVKVDYTYDNLYDNDWKVYVAAYDGNGLVCVKVLQKGEDEITIPKADRYEAFIWEGCMPLCDSVEYK